MDSAERANPLAPSFTGITVMDIPLLGLSKEPCIRPKVCSVVEHACINIAVASVTLTRLKILGVKSSTIWTFPSYKWRSH